MATRQEVDAARRGVEVRRLERRDRIAAASDYTGFVVTKVVGLATLVGGGFEVLAPSVLPIVLPHAPEVAAVGFALLVGRDVIARLKPVLAVLLKAS